MPARSRKVPTNILRQHCCIPGIKTPSNGRWAQRLHAVCYLLVCTIFMADAIKADTSDILLGTISVVVESAATLE